ncbi:MAG: GIY-YIG nuclease family protein [Patescibacteria group bacterium]
MAPACPVGRELVDTHDLPAGRQAQNHVMYYTYAIKSLKFNYIYTGISDNPIRRISQHNKGYNRTTKPYIPFKIILLEKYKNRKEAREREIYLKSGAGKEYLKNLK